MNKKLYNITVIISDDSGEVKITFEKVGFDFDSGYLHIRRVSSSCKELGTFEKTLPIISISEERILRLYITDYDLGNQRDLRWFYE